MAGTKKIKLVGTAMWARLREDNRDVGGGNTPKNIQDKLDKVGGNYLLDLYFDDTITRKDLIKAGIPHTGMLGQLIKEDDEGNLFYKCKREHRRISSRDGKEHIFGPPKVLNSDDEDWDWQTDGLIGNGSRVEVTMNRWDGDTITLISMESVKVLDHVPYEMPEREEPEVTVVGSSSSTTQKKVVKQELDDEIPF